MEWHNKISRKRIINIILVVLSCYLVFWVLWIISNHLDPYNALERVADLMIGISTVAVAIFAYLGLETWKRELRGGAEFKVAQDLLKSVFRVRDSIKECRSSDIDIFSELPEPNRNSVNSQQEDIMNSLLSVYESRFGKILEGVPELKAATRAAEALWGVTIKNKILILHNCINELRDAIRKELVIHLMHLKNGGELKATDNFRQIISDEKDTTTGINPFTKKINEAFTDIEQEVRLHLHY